MRLRTLILFVAAVALAGFTQRAEAQLSISWYTIDGGGGTSTGGSLTLHGSIGQHDAGASMTGGTLTLTGGYWGAGGVGACPGNQCGSQDFNGDGDFGTDQDIEAFFACLAGTCCPTCFCQGADFNGDGDFGTDQDIEAFFRVLSGGSC